MAAQQARADCFYGIADLHSLTVPHDPARLRALVAEQAASLLAVGLVARGSTPEEMKRSIQSEYERWGPLVKKIGFTAES